MLPLVTPGRQFCVPATTVRTVTTSKEWVMGANKGMYGKMGPKPDEGVGHGRLSFLARCPTAHGEVAQ